MRPTQRLALFLLFAGSSAPAFAQEAPPRPPRQDTRQAEARRPAREHLTPEQRAERHVQHLDRQLTLTDAQEAQIRRILVDRAAQHERQMQQRREARPQAPRPEDRRSARPQLTPEQRDALRSRMRTEMAQTQRQILAVLTPQQAERYRSLQAERRTKAQQHRQQRGERRGDRTPGQGRTPR